MKVNVFYFMVIKRIFIKIKDNNKERLQKDIKNINTSGVKKIKNEDESDGDVNFKNGFEIFFVNDKVIDKKTVNIKQNEEGSSEEAYKNPKKKNKSKDDEIYSDFTDKPFVKNLEKEEREVEEFKLTQIVEPESGETKIVINKSKKNKKSFRSF